MTFSADKPAWPLRFGVDDAGGPHPLHEHPRAADIFKEFGFDLWVMHFLPPAGRLESADHQLAYLQRQGVVLNIPEDGPTPDLAAVARYIRSVDAWCREHGIHWIANLESANFITSYVDGLGRDWYAHADGRHFFRFPEDVLQTLSRTDRLLGVMFDEAEHMQNSCDPDLAARTHIAGLGKPFFYDPKNTLLEEAAERFTIAAREEGARYREKGLRLFTEHVFPVLFHPFSHAGYTAATKVLKENWSPLAMACAMGAALQYGTELWVTPDLWGMSGYPSHSPDAYWSTLLLAYHLGADCIYTENLAYDHEGNGYGSLIHLEGNEYRVTPHGERARRFIREYVPAHPRRYSFREVRPRVAIIRRPDACWGQRGSWLPDTLFGNTEWPSRPATEAWFAVWHLLSRGTVSTAGLTWHCAAMQGRPQQVFLPLDGVLVFDDHVRQDCLQDVEAILLTGLAVSETTLAAVTECVRRGALCVALPHLVPRTVLAHTGNYGQHKEGTGRWVVAQDFLSALVREHAAPFLPETDRIRYRFGDTTVTLRMIDNDPNRLAAEMDTSWVSSSDHQ